MVLWFFKYIFSFSSCNTFKIVDALVRVKFRLPWGGFCLIFAYNSFFLFMPHHFEYCNVAALEPRLHSLYIFFLLLIVVIFICLVTFPNLSSRYTLLCMAVEVPVLFTSVVSL